MKVRRQRLFAGSTRSAVILVLACAALVMAAPASTLAQRPGAMAVLDTLGLESGQMGHVTYYFATPDKARAQALASLINDAAAAFDRELDLRFDLSLAALGPDQWFSEFPGVPYAVPWASIPERLLLLPSSLSQGVLITGPNELADRRRVDFVALHEYGHVAAKECFRPTAVEPYTPVSWFEELIATYFAYSYVAAADPEWASAARAEWSSQIEAFTPSVVSLDWSFMNSLPGPDLSRTYAWYQFVMNKRAAELYDRHGVALLPRLKAALLWKDASGWTPAGLLTALDGVTPELASWARDFGRQ